MFTVRSRFAAAALLLVAAACGLDPGDSASGTPDLSSSTPGPVPSWCDVKPILAASCVSSCHGADTSGSGRTDFRLDTYERVGDVAGAQLMAPRIHARAFVFRTMPPPGSPPPTDAERELLARWAAGDAPPCDTSG